MSVRSSRLLEGERRDGTPASWRQLWSDRTARYLGLQARSCHQRYCVPKGLFLSGWPIGPQQVGVPALDPDGWGRYARSQEVIEMMWDYYGAWLWMLPAVGTIALMFWVVRASIPSRAAVDPAVEKLRRRLAAGEIS